MNNQLYDYSRYQTHFDTVSNQIVHEPVQNRKRTDSACLIVFFMFWLIFITFGVIEINDYVNNYKDIPFINSTSQNQGKEEGLIFWRHFPGVSAGIIISILVAYGYVLLVRSFPVCMVYFLLAITSFIVLVVAIIGLILGNIAVFISFLVLLLIYGLIVFCFKDKINTGIALLKAATVFLSEKSSVFLTPLIKIVLTFIIATWGSLSISASVAIMYHKDEAQQDIGFEAFCVSITSLCLLFFLLLCYYMMCYTISSVCANWYYGIRGSKGSLKTAYSNMFKQLGTLVFGASVIVIFTMARMAVNNQRRRRNNGCVALCLCLVQCILRSMEELIRVINHFTVITVAVTGEGFIEGAESTLGLLWQQLALLNVIDIITGLLVWWGMVITIIVPSCLSYMFVVINEKKNNITTNDSVAFTVAGIVAVCSTLIGTVVFEIIVQSVSCLFIYFAMDKNFLLRGLIAVPRIPNTTYEQINRYSANPYLMEGNLDEGTQDNYGNGGNYNNGGFNGNNGGFNGNYGNNGNYGKF